MSGASCGCRCCRRHLSEGSTEAEGPPWPRGRARRSSQTIQAAWRFGRGLARLGFDVRHHFVERWAERAIARGMRAGPEQLARWFDAGPHFRDVRPGHNSSLARTPLGFVVYRVGGPRGNRVVLITLVDDLPRGAMPKPTPRRAGGHATA